MFQACVPLASAACGVTQKRCERAQPEVGMSFTHANAMAEREARSERRCVEA